MFIQELAAGLVSWNGEERSGAEQHLEGGEHEEADADRKRELREYVLGALEAALSCSRTKSGQVKSSHTRMSDHIKVCSMEHETRRLTDVRRSAFRIL